MILTLLLSLTIAPIEPASFLDLTPENAPLVTTKNGKILGANFKVEGGEFSYYGFQGIPYAEPPIGKRRFLPPQPKDRWHGVLNATKDIPVCMQPITEQYGTYMSEDCLFLNVYTPNLKGSLPVMVYIYGGGFISGTASKRIYGPDFLIQENVVLVVPNYRLGIFGFLSTLDKVSPGNYGLKDQIMALQWVKENIATFGGNPDSVTIFGESAGSASVSILLQAKPARGLFHGAIMESGVSLSLFSRTRDPLEVAKTTARNLKIDASKNEDLVKKLREVSAEKLRDASIETIVKAVALGTFRNGLPFSPTIEPEHEGAVLTEKSHESLKNRRFSKVPIIVGFTSAEGNSFVEAIGNQSLSILGDGVNNGLLVPASMNVNDNLKKKVGEEIKTYYFGNNKLGDSPLKLSKFISDDQFVRPTLEMVRLVSPVIPTYLYEFSYEGSASISPKNNLPGVGHAEDVRYLWYMGMPLDEKDSITSKKLVKLWTNFAKYRNPTPIRSLMLDRAKWIPNNRFNQYLQINRTLNVETNLRKRDMDFWTNLFNKYGNPPYDTY